MGPPPGVCCPQLRGRAPSSRGTPRPPHLTRPCALESGSADGRRHHHFDHVPLPTRARNCRSPPRRQSDANTVPPPFPNTDMPSFSVAAHTAAEADIVPAYSLSQACSWFSRRSRGRTTRIRRPPPRRNRDMSSLPVAAQTAAGADPVLATSPNANLCRDYNPFLVTLHLASTLS